MICNQYGRSNDTDEDISQEVFYHHYQKYNAFEIGKKIVGIIKCATLILGLVAFICFIAAISIDSDIVPNAFGYEVSNSTDAEMFEFIYKILLIIALLILIPLTMTCLGDILDWLSMQNFSKKLTSNNINGISLLTERRLSDKRGKKEYIFISNSLCMIDEPSQKIARGVKVIVKLILNVALYIVIINFISYYSFTLAPSVGDPDDFSLMMYTDNEFWLDPNIFLVGIAIWSNILINLIVDAIVNKKYTRWVKKIQNKVNERNEMY